MKDDLDEHDVPIILPHQLPKGKICVFDVAGEKLFLRYDYHQADNTHNKQNLSWQAKNGRERGHSKDFIDPRVEREGGNRRIDSLRREISNNFLQIDELTDLNNPSTRNSLIPGSIQFIRNKWVSNPPPKEHIYSILYELDSSVEFLYEVITNSYRNIKTEGNVFFELVKLQDNLRNLKNSSKINEISSQITKRRKDKSIEILWNQINERFNKDELFSILYLRFGLEGDVLTGDTKGAFITALIQHFQRREQLDDLVKEFALKRPPWEIWEWWFDFLAYESDGIPTI